MTTQNEGTQRDELARDIFLADNARAPESMMLADWEALNKRANGETYAHPIADGLIAKGYGKPRTITTVEELDALPDGSGILDGSGDVGQKLSGRWYFPETASMGSSKVAKYGPATVLWEPEAEATR